MCVFSVNMKNTLREVGCSVTLSWSPFSKGVICVVYVENDLIASLPEWFQTKFRKFTLIIFTFCSKKSKLQKREVKFYNELEMKGLKPIEY